MPTTQYWLAVGIALFASSLWAADPPKYTSVEQIPAELRGEFQAGYKEFKQAMSEFAELQRKSAVELPLYEFARQRIDESQRIADGFNEARRTDLERFKQQGDEVFRDFKKWLSLYEGVVARDIGIELLQDPRSRVILGEAALQAFDAEGIQSGKWADVQAMFPDTKEELTVERAAEIWVEWLRGKAAANEQKLAKLESSLKLSDANKATALLWMRNQVSVPYFELYVSRHTPDALEEAERKAAAISGNLSKIWPGWQQVLKEAEYTPFPERKVASATAPPQPLPATDLGPRRILLAINLGFLGIICLVVLTRRWFRPRSPADADRAA
jgi:hypothetical protein